MLKSQGLEMAMTMTRGASGLRSVVKSLAVVMAVIAIMFLALTGIVNIK